MEAVLQVVIVDCSQSLWRDRDQLLRLKTSGNGHQDHHGASPSPSPSLLTYDDLIRVLLLFCNAHSSLSRDNLLCVLASGEGSACETIFPSSDLVRLHSERAYLPLLASFCEDVTERLLSLYLSPSSSPSPADHPPEIRQGSLSKSLSRALCIINRRLQANPQLSAKILILQLSEDEPQSYNLVMNCIFSAQKLGVLVDSLVLSAHDSSFLQQASFLTGGVYLRPKDQSLALQSLFHHVLPSSRARQDYLVSPLQRSVDFKASCSCHGTQVEFTYMCSVCLSLYCAVPEKRCETCGTPVRH